MTKRNKHLFWHIFILSIYIIALAIFLINNLNCLALLCLPSIFFIAAIYRFCAEEVLIISRLQSPYLQKNDSSDTKGIDYLILAIITTCVSIYKMIDIYILH